MRVAKVPPKKAQKSKGQQPAGQAIKDNIRIATPPKPRIPTSARRNRLWKRFFEEKAIEQPYFLRASFCRRLPE
jgi:hypothetical protein